MGKRWTSENIEDQSGRVAIVTGANSGIGYETAKALAAKGATVVLACRSEERGEAALARLADEVPGADASLRLLDLASLASVERFAAAFLGEHERLDLLINNAGVMMPPTRRETADGFELQFGTNHLGHFALTLRLMDRLVATKGSRVVNVSSTAQKMGGFDLDDLDWSKRSYAKLPSYGQSKIANMLFTLELSRRFEEAGVDTVVTAAHPGWTSTNLQKDTWWIRWFNPMFGMQPWQGALPTLYAAVGDVEPGAYYGPHGLGTMRGYPVKNAPSKISTDAEKAAQLWAVSERSVGLEMPALTAASAPRARA